ncbi:MAG: DUF368 domain-containing protein [Bacillota bacterium]
MLIIQKLMQGMAIGMAFVLPGLSAGTVILIMGFYRRFIEDLSRVNLKPYIPHLFGCAAGAYAGVKIIVYLMLHFSDLLMAFLLGMLVASVRTVLIQSKTVRFTPAALLLAAAGFGATWFVLCDPSSGFALLGPATPVHFLLGGALASATMLLPGVSGSAALIMLNFYDNVLMAVNNWQWLNLAFFAAGTAIGLFGLARVLTAVYRRFESEVSLLLAGMILGSTRALLPEHVTIGVIVSALAGALLVICLSRPRRERII